MKAALSASATSSAAPSFTYATVPRCSPAGRRCSRSSSQPRQPEHPLGDDVAQDLGGAALDRVGAGAQEAIGPLVVLQLGPGPGDVHGELGERLVDLRPVPLPQ